jgi:DNA-binding IscR family transcriptional regulator
MKNTKLSDAVHLLVYLLIHVDEQPSSQDIANSINTNPVVVRRLMSELAQTGFIKTNRGSSKVEFLHEPNQINLFDLYKAIDHRHLFDLDENTNQDDFLGHNLPLILEKHYREAVNITAQYLETITLADLINEVNELK